MCTRCRAFLDSFLPTEVFTHSLLAFFFFFPVVVFCPLVNLSSHPSHRDTRLGNNFDDIKNHEFFASCKGKWTWSNIRTSKISLWVFFFLSSTTLRSCWWFHSLDIWKYVLFFWRSCCSCSWFVFFILPQLTPPLFPNWRVTRIRAILTTSRMKTSHQSHSRSRGWVWLIWLFLCCFSSTNSKIGRRRTCDRRMSSRKTQERRSLN